MNILYKIFFFVIISAQTYTIFQQQNKISKIESRLDSSVKELNNTIQIKNKEQDVMNSLHNGNFLLVIQLTDALAKAQKETRAYIQTRIPK